MTRTLGALGAALLGLGVLVAYASRGRASVPALALLLLGATLVVAAVLAYVHAQRRGDGLVPTGALVGALPAPAWWAPILAAGTAVAAGGALAGGSSGRWVAAGGALLVAAAVLDLGRRLERAPAAVDRPTVRSARALRRFAVRHGNGGATALEGVLEPVGRGSARLLVVAADGAVGDAVLGSERAALAAAMAGVTLHETFPRELADRLVTGRYAWRRMAGSQLRGGD